MKIIWRYLASLGLTLGLLLLAEYLVGWRQILAAWLLVPWNQLLLPALLVLASYALRGLRLRGWFGALAWQPLCQVVVLHNFWNNLLPMRAGEASFPLLLRRKFNIQLMPATAALLWFRVLDLACLLLIFGLACAWTFIPAMPTMPAMPALLLLPPLLMLLLFLLYKLFKVPARFRHHRLVQRHEFVSQLAAGASPPGRVLRTLFWTLLNWLVKLAAYGYVITLFSGVKLHEGVLGAIGGEATSVLPIHGFAGAGSYEAGVLLLLQLTSLSLDEALAAGINLHLFLLSITVIAGAIAPLLASKQQSR